MVQPTSQCRQRSPTGALVLSLLLSVWWLGHRRSLVAAEVSSTALCRNGGRCT